jgi:catechol 2,3-dioxygenase-like lactoylglutathione lyase family enzyme
MITKFSLTTVWVLDQEAAKKFYTEKLGFEVRTDQTTGPLRWLTVGPKGQPDHELILAKPAPPLADEESGKQIAALVARGVLGPGAMDTDDMAKTFKELKAKGVTFVMEPAERPYGIEALFRDDSGNPYSLVQRPKVAS